jgi:uncharacterized protein (TIGR03083 family)
MTPAERVLLGDIRTLLPVLRQLDESRLASDTICTGWSVLDVVAHVGSALAYVAKGQSYDPSPEANAVEVRIRRNWTSEQVLDEYERGLRQAGAAIATSAGTLDGAALGTWIHGGDIRQALTLPDAYASDGFDDAIILLQTNARVTSTPLVRAVLPHRVATFGATTGERPPASLECDVATLFRLYSGRQPDTTKYRLAGVEPHELVSQQW